MSRIIATPALLVLMFGGASRGARAADPPTESAAAELRGGTHPVPRLGFTLLAGLGIPACGSQSCSGTFGPAPSLQALVLYQPHPSWAFGLVGQIERLHWETFEQSMLNGVPYRVESNVTAGFAGLAGRYVPSPERFLTPVVQVALGWGFQGKGFPYDCENGASPTAQIAFGGRARVSSSAFVFAMASVRGEANDGCFVLDAPSLPLATWGFAVHAGGSFDVALGHAGPATPASSSPTKSSTWRAETQPR
jgi:hypothetical protein